MSVVHYDIVIIGAGPAGISLAVEGVEAGILPEKILLLEKAPKHSWSIRKYYPEDKLVTANYKGHDSVCEGVMCLFDSSKDEALSYLDKAISDHKLEVRYQCEVHEIMKMKKGDYVIKAGGDEIMATTIGIAIGVLARAQKPSYSIPSEVNQRVHYDVSNISGSAQRCLVVGGGDSASEYTQFLAGKGHKVTLSYRRDSFHRMIDMNRDTLFALEKSGKADLYVSSDIEKLGNDNSLPRVVFKERDAETFDHVIFALGGTSPKNFLEKIGISYTNEGPEVSSDYESGHDGLFLVGDVAAGGAGGSINLAFNSAHKAIKQFCRQYLDCKYT